MFTILTPAKIVLVSASIYKIKKVFSNEHLATFCHTKEIFNELDKITSIRPVVIRTLLLIITRTIIDNYL